MRKILSFILLSIVYTSAFKCTDALQYVIYTKYNLNHNYVLVQENKLDLIGTDTSSYQITEYKWTGTTKNNKLDFVYITKIIDDNERIKNPYTDKYNADNEGSGATYTENDSMGHVEIFAQGNPYFSSYIDFSGDILVTTRLRFTDDRTFIQKSFLKNDTIFYQEVRFYGASKDTVIKPDTSFFLYANDSKDEGLCREYKYYSDSLQFILQKDSDRHVRQNGDSVIITDIYHNDEDQYIKKENIFLPVKKVFPEGTTSLPKNWKKPQHKTKKDKHFDLKGRFITKQIPYRVIF